MTGLAMREREPSWPEIWANTRDQLRIELGQGVFDTWIAPLSLLDVADGHVRLSAPRRLVRDYVALHHAARIERAFTAQTKAFASLEIVVSAIEPRVGAGAPPVSPSGSIASESMGREPRRGGANGGGGGIWDREPDGQQSFENFVTGPANEFAFKTARRLAEGSDADLGILYLHGGFGFGKTHLLPAIALEARKTRGARALLLRAEDFMVRFIGA